MLVFFRIQGVYHSRVGPEETRSLLYERGVGGRNHDTLLNITSPDHVAWFLLGFSEIKL